MEPLSKNQYSVDDTKTFPNMLASIQPLQGVKEDVSYDVESLFTHILIEETINYIIKQFYIQNNLTPICTKLIFRNILVKPATECTFKFNNLSLKQVDRCTMDQPLSFKFSDVYMIKIENDLLSNVCKCNL